MTREPCGWVYHGGMRYSRQTRILVILAATALCVACQDTASPVDVAGTYELSSTTGTIGRLETPVGGSLVLTAEGAAERRVSYYRDSTNAVTDDIALGTYHIVGTTIDLALRQDSGQSAFVWRVTATIENGGLLRLSYPRPADGTIVEVYLRAACPVCRQTTP